MASYYYLISSLPMLRPNEEPPLDYPSFLGMCRTVVSESTYQRLAELTEESEEGPLLSEWAVFYRSLKTELNYQRNLKLGWPCAISESRDIGVMEAVNAALTAKNPLEAEQVLMRLEFGRLDSIIGLHNFDDQALYGYAMKLRLLERQRGFRYETGKLVFQGLLDGLQQQIFSIG